MAVRLVISLGRQHDVRELKVQVTAIAGNEARMA
jgi:hypothetical protein